jgi:hypothetical protein
MRGPPAPPLHATPFRHQATGVVVFLDPEMEATMLLEKIDGENWQDFLSAEACFLMLGKSDCGACNEWTAELEQYLADAPDFEGKVRFGKMLLDQRGLTEFKRAHGGWLKDVHDLPFNTLWLRGEKKKDWPGSGLERLKNRVDNLLAG